MEKPDTNPRRPPQDDYTPSRFLRLQEHDLVAGTFWVGTKEDSEVQAVWKAASDFQQYVNALLDRFGHVPYWELTKGRATAAPAPPTCKAPG